MKAHAEKLVSDAQMKQAAFRFPENTVCRFGALSVLAIRFSLSVCCVVCQIDSCPVTFCPAVVYCTVLHCTALYCTVLHRQPLTKESYLYRSIFESHYPQASARACVPGGPSIACSTPTAILWDESFQKSADPSGRAVAGVHSESYATATAVDSKSAAGKFEATASQQTVATAGISSGASDGGASPAPQQRANR